MILCNRAKQTVLSVKRVLYESDSSESEFSDGNESINSNSDDDEIMEISDENQNLIPLDISECKIGMWVKVVYEGELFIGKVQGKQNNSVEVQCLEHPFGIKNHQDMEKDSVHYDKVFSCGDCEPRLVKVGRTWKWTY